MSSWPEFVDGSEYSVRLKSETEEVHTTLDYDEGRPFVLVAGSGDGPLYFRVLGITLYALAGHSDDVWPRVTRWDPDLQRAFRAMVPNRLYFADPFSPGSAPTAESFRAECDFGVAGMRNMVRVDLADPPPRTREALARIWLLCPELQAGRLREGFPFVVYAGAQRVANGTIETVVDRTLQNGA